DVRDEFVSVTEKLMDELAQCYNVLPQLDINNTIDHRPEGDEKWFLENEKTVTQFCRKLAAERPLKDIRDEYNYPKKKGIKDECSRLLEASTMKSRRGFAIQRLMNAMLCLLINRRSLLLALRLLWKTPIFPSNSRFPRLCAKCLLKLKRLVSILPMTKSKK